MPAIYAESSEAAYAQGARMPIPENAIIVFGNPVCGHCRDSMHNNNNIIQTSNGTPVVWLDTRNLSPEQLEALGVRWDRYIAGDGSERMRLVYANGQITGTPTAIGRVNGTLGPVLDTQDLSRPGAYEALANEMRAQAAARQALNEPGGGTSVPYAAAGTTPEQGRSA